MFNLFKKPLSPEEQLKKDITEAFDSAVKLAFKDSPSLSVAGMYVNSAISSLYKSFNNNSVDIARQYRLPILTVGYTIKWCTNDALLKYLDNGEDYLV